MEWERGPNKMLFYPSHQVPTSNNVCIIKEPKWCHEFEDIALVFNLLFFVLALFLSHFSERNNSEQLIWAVGIFQAAWNAWTKYQAGQEIILKSYSQGETLGYLLLFRIINSYSDFNKAQTLVCFTGMGWVFYPVQQSKGIRERKHWFSYRKADKSIYFLPPTPKKQLAICFCCRQTNN